jgi:hypothetical protein
MKCLVDDSPRARKALRDVLYGNRSRLDIARLSRMVDAFSEFTTDALVKASPAPQLALASTSSSTPRGPLVDPATREVRHVLILLLLLLLLLLRLRLRLLLRDP